MKHVYSAHIGMIRNEQSFAFVLLHLFTPDHREQTQTEVVRTCLSFIRSGQNHLARHSEKGKEGNTDGRRGGKQHQGMDRPGARQVPEGSG